MIANVSKFLLPMSLWALTAGHVPAAAALQDSDTRSIAVAISDLDLTAPRDRHALDKRIDRAARQICGLPSIPHTTEELRCVSQAVRRARPQRDAAISSAQRPTVGMPAFTAEELFSAPALRSQR